MNNDVARVLVQDMDALLDMSNVGLYEFIWNLRGRYPEMSLNEYQEIAAEALRIILARGNVKVGFLVWPSQDMVGYRASDDFGVNDWDDPGDGPYPALTLDEPEDEDEQGSTRT